MASTTKKLSTSSLYLVTLAIVPAFFLTATSDVFNTPKAVLFVALTVGTLAHAYFSRLPKVYSREEKFVLIILSLLSIGIVISSVASDTTIARMVWGYPGRANGLLYYLAIFTSVYLGVKLQLQGDFYKRLKRALNFSFILVVGYSLVQYLDLDPVPWSNDFEIIATFGNPNFAAAFSGIVTIFYLYQFLSVKSGNRYIALLLAILASFLTFETGSIQGPAIVLIMIFLMVTRYLKSKLSLKLFVTYLVASSTFAVLAFVSMLGYGTFGDSVYQYTLRLRMDYWLLGIKTGMNWPLTGVGTDSYVEGFKLLRDQSFVDKWGAGLISDSAHSSPLNFLANFGFINFLFMLILIGLISTRAIQILFGRQAVSEFAPIVAIMWFGMLAQSLFSIEQVGLGVFQWLIGGLILNSAAIDKQKAEKSNREGNGQSKLTINSRFSYEFRGELSLAVFLVSLFLLSPVLREDLRAREILATNINQSTPNEFLDSRISSLSYISRDEVRRGLIFSNALLSANKIAEAENFLLKIVDKDPQAIEALLSLSRIQRYFNRIEEEIAFRQQIEGLDPWNYDNKLALVEAYMLLNKGEDARKVAEQLNKIAPNTVEAESATALVDNK